MRRARYQRGSLRSIKRKDGTKVWEFRWRETQRDGTRKRRSIIVGSIEDYPTESLAQAEVDNLRLNINPFIPHRAITDINVGALVNHYREHELPDIFYKDEPDKISDEPRKSWSTQDTYDGYLRKWILPRWRSYRLSEVKAVAVEQWLKTLSFENGDSLARGSKAKIRNIMSALYSHAIRWEWTTSNPIASVRQSAKRQSVPAILTVDELVKLLSAIPEPFRTAVFLDGASGLRVGELLGLKWADVDFKKSVIKISRSIVKQKNGPTKTEASKKQILLN